MGIERDGCWASLVAVPHEAVHALPEGVDSVVGATFFVPWSTAQVALFEVGELRSGERLAVRGATGAVGSLVVQLALAAGAAEVVAASRTAERGSSLPVGATPYREGDWAVLAEEGGVDLLVDTVGGAALPEALDAVRSGGRAVLVGYVGGESATLSIPRLLARDVRVLPVNQLRHEAALFAVAPAALERLACGELEVRSTALPLARLEEALAALRGGGGRVAVTIRG